MTFSLDGKFLATADTDRIVDIWSVKSQKIVNAMHEPKVSMERIGSAAVSNVTGLAFDKTGTRLVLVDNGYGTIGRYEGSRPLETQVRGRLLHGGPPAQRHLGW